MKWQKTSDIRVFPRHLVWGNLGQVQRDEALIWRTHEVGHKCYGVGLFIFVIDFMLYYRLPKESSLILLYSFISFNNTRHNLVVTFLDVMVIQTGNI